MSRTAWIAVVVLLCLSFAAICMAIFASALGLGLQYSFRPYLWFGIARTNLAAIGVLLALLAAAVWATEHIRRAFCDHPNQIFLLIGLGFVPALFVLIWFGRFNGFTTLRFAADACLGALWVGAIFFLLTMRIRGARTRSFDMAVNVSLLVLSSLLTVAAAEVAVRLMDRVPVFAVRNWAAERRALLQVHAPIRQFDSVLGWVQKPNLRLHPDNPNISFTTSSRGFRLSGPDAAAPPAKGAILAVGDSFTAGDAVGDRDSWPAKLEELLQQPIINAASGGWGADQIVLRAEALLSEVMPTKFLRRGYFSRWAQILFWGEQAVFHFAKWKTGPA
jgi:hypothetical protein